MFKMRVILLALVLIVISIGISIARISERDRTLYEGLLESSHSTPGEKASLPFTQQTRESVSKQVWSYPHHLRIDSDESELFVYQQDDEYEVVEHLGNVRCVMQEELFYHQQIPMQRVRYLEAEKALYNYNSQLFIADDAKLWQYELEGHEPVESFEDLPAKMTGTAEHVEATLADFQAEKMEAQFIREEDLFSVVADKADYDRKEITLVGNVILENSMGHVTALKAVLHRDEERQTNLDFPWVKLTSDVKLSLSNGGELSCDALWCDYVEKRSTFTGDVTYTDEMGEIYADRAQVDYTECEGSLKPTKIILVDRVRLVDQEGRYGLADFVVYYPEEQLMILEGRKNRVLFYDQARDVKLSAPTVHAQRNLKSGKDSIQGVGDVRFIFGPEELEQLREHFGQYNIKG